MKESVETSQFSNFDRWRKEEGGEEEAEKERISGFSFEVPPVTCVYAYSD